MKRFSVKTKVAIWYVSFLVIVVALVFVAIIGISDHLIQNDIKEDLKTKVTENADRISVKNGKLDISNRLENYKDGIYILVYEDGGFLITGMTPDTYPDNIGFDAGAVRKVKEDGISYYVYDKLISSKGYTGIWVRGMTPADVSVSDPAVKIMIALFLIILPLLILIAIFGGYRITRRAFLPVAQIATTAEEISSGRDLSKRIPSEHTSNNNIEDKDEIRMLARTFNDMLDRLETSFESEKQFSDDASHELRTPIAVIMAQCEYALSESASPEEVRSALQIIFKQSKKMSALISQLLTLARSDKGFEKLDLEKTDISMLVEMTSEQMQDPADARGIKITTDIQEDIIALADQTMLTRLLINLISNSINYGKENGSINISLQKDSDGRILCTVSDDGIGIAPKDLPKIWDRFYQADPSRSAKQNNENYSIGLGLSMVKWIAEAHNGSVEVQSTLGKGSSFTLILPAQKTFSI